MHSTVTGRAVFRLRCMTVVGRRLGQPAANDLSTHHSKTSTMALSENYRSETIGRSDRHPIVRLSADTIVRWDCRPNASPNVRGDFTAQRLSGPLITNRCLLINNNSQWRTGKIIRINKRLHTRSVGSHPSLMCPFASITTTQQICSGR